VKKLKDLAKEFRKINIVPVDETKKKLKRC
jgi:hypothetical protein